MTNYKIDNNIIQIETKKSHFFIELINDGMIRLFSKKCANDLTKYAFKYNKVKFCSVNGEYLEIKLKQLLIKINDNSDILFFKNNIEIFSISDFVSQVNDISNINVFNENHIFGLGDKLNTLDKRGYYYESYNSDIATRHDELTPALYKSINFMLLERYTNFIGVYYPSTYKYSFDICKNKLNNIVVSSEKAEKDMILFLDNDVQNIISAFSKMCGNPFFVRMKMLGNNQSRWSYKNESEVMDVLNNHIKYEIPLDYIHLDIDYLNNYKVLTINKERFPDFKKISENCKENGVDIVTITDAGVKKEDGYFVYDYLHNKKLFCTLNGEEYINIVWPGESAFPNYFSPKTQKFFIEQTQKFIVENGISGIWNDMNEPASFKGELPLEVDMSYGKRILNNEEGHNLYGQKMAEISYKAFLNLNLRPYVFTRACFSTTSKYAFVWNGDNFSLWHHLRMSLPQVMTLSLCNFMFNGDDIGGFGGDGNKQILIRWAESNVLFPFFRNHSSINTVFQEPYSFDEETLNIYKNVLKTRYEFIPYLYNLCYLANKKGKLIVRPLFYNYQNNSKVYDVNDEYMVGDNVLISPILDKDVNERIVTFPGGNWINYFTNEKYSSKKKYIVDMPIKEFGLYIKENSIIPQYSNLLHIEKEKIDTLILRIYGTKGKLELYDDDGYSNDYLKGIFNIYDIKFAKNTLHFKTKYQRYKTSYKYIKIVAKNKEIVKKFDYNISINIEEAL